MHTGAVQYYMKDVGYRLRRSAIVRGFMEVADMAVGGAVAAVLSWQRPFFGCLREGPNGHWT